MITMMISETDKEEVFPNSFCSFYGNHFSNTSIYVRRSDGMSICHNKI